MKLNLLLFLLVIGGFKGIAQQTEELTLFVLIVQPIVVQSDEGTDPASMVLPENLVDNAYSKAGVDFHFLEPIYFNNTKARDEKCCKSVTKHPNRWIFVIVFMSTELTA